MLALLLAASFTGCGTERVLVKNLLDHPALTAPQPATVEQLLTLRPPRWGNRAPRHRIERTVVVVDVEVLAFKNEADGDIHVIIRGAPGAVMIAELPLQTCTARSPYAAQMQRARSTFLRLARARVQRMRLTGVIFFDKLHGQVGGAPNGVELHPVLKVEALR
jgi:hypothetical protein